MQEDQQQDERKFFLIPDQKIAKGSQQDRPLQEALGVGMLLDLTHPERRSDHAHQRAGRSDQANLLPAESQADIKKIHERQHESPSAHEGEVIYSCKE